MSTKRPPRTSAAMTPRAVATSLSSAALVIGGLVAAVPSAHAAEPAPAASAPSSASAGQDAARPAAAPSAARSTGVTVNNYSGSGMQRVWAGLAHGCWTDGQLPTDYLPSGRSTAWGSQSCGFMTGTEGDADFAVDGGQVKIHWNNPWAGSNSYSCTVPDGYSCTRSGGSGDNANVTFTVTGGHQRLKALTKAHSPATVQAARSTYVTLNNNTGGLLGRSYDRLDGGIWTDNRLPPGNIPPGRSGSWQSESDGFMTGTEGEVQYLLAGAGYVTVHWNNPYVGSNSYSCTVPAHYTCSRTGGGGDNATVAFTVSHE
ncbi:Crystal protein ET79 [Streptomyces sp. NPDC001388]|uniref:Crystal protein ET79 n=1 Tax=Streptomyces sp. NPDC001388 TaxID=3364568 RepID=UPI0036BE0797